MTTNLQRTATALSALLLLSLVALPGSHALTESFAGRTCENAVVFAMSGDVKLEAGRGLTPEIIDDDPSTDFITFNSNLKDATCDGAGGGGGGGGHPTPDPDGGSLLDELTNLAPGGVTLYSCLAWLCAYASAHQDQEDVNSPDEPVTKLTTGGAISQATFRGGADIETSLGSGSCRFDPLATPQTSGCGLSWSEVDWSCQRNPPFIAKATAFDTVFSWGAPWVQVTDPVC